MAQTSDEQSRKINGTIREPLKVESNIPQDKQKYKGWYWCNEKRGLFRYSDWHKSLTELNLTSS
jgi:ligand-binding sensor domain-containing protein